MSLPDKEPSKEASPWPNLKWSFKDARDDKNRSGDFTSNKAAEIRYERQLMSLTAQVNRIIKSGKEPVEIEEALREYGRIVEPWARQSASNMLAGVDRKNVKAWRGMAQKMGHDMKNLIEGPGLGAALREQIEKNTATITNLVIGSADRVSEIVKQGLYSGSRAVDLTKQLEGIEGINSAKARTIARTEVSKAQTALTKERAKSIGSTGYIWRTASDGDVRESHRKMEGKFVSWDSPPTLDGMTGHAGEFINDRCYCEPVIPREDDDGKIKGVYRQPLQTRAAAQNIGQKTLYTKWEQEIWSAVIPHAPGTPLLGVEHATFNMGKLTHYSMDLDAKLPDGKDNMKAISKAIKFKNELGLTKEHAPMIEKMVMEQLPHLQAYPNLIDEHGVRFNVYVPITGPNGRTIDVMTAWQYDRDRINGKFILTRPRMINCFIDRKLDKDGKYRGY